MKLLLYCTKAKPYLNDWKLANPNKRYFISNTRLWSIDSITQQPYYKDLNGKVVAECDFEVEKITSSNFVDFEKESCIDRVSMLKYLKPNLIWNHKFEILLDAFGGLTLGYAIHIKNLHIFDKPKELSEYYKYNKYGLPYYLPVRKAPQNMMSLSNNDILISIQPQWLCKILNGDKTIEIRKKVLKGMLKDDK